MAICVIGGLITSTMLTLFVVPVVYTILDDVTALVLRRAKPSESSTVHGLPVPEPAAGD
jgi:HAE1 family hydrophobic/amphiphilic exporter-1